MCEQTPVEYKGGDIVWVKLGPCWWPGEVQAWDELPSDVTSTVKKPPLAAVKFFQEESFEFVKNINQIYSYNCKKKNEFIKKGLDLHRAKNAFMEKFPADIVTAETKTGGDPNILNSASFQSDKKPNYAALVFGSPSPKRALKDSNRNSKGRTSLKNQSPSNSKRPSNIVTHRRFIGHDDHQVRVLLQPSTETKPESQTNYRCHTCGFESCRIDVIVLHNKSHIQGVYTPTTTVRRVKKLPIKSKKGLKSSHTKTTKANYDIDSSMSEDEEDEPKPKRKRKSQSGKRKQKKVEQTEHKETKLDIQNVIAEWDDESEPEFETSTLSSNLSLNTSESPMKEPLQQSKDEAKTENVQKDLIKSCFDFEDEEDDQIIGTSVGRKIPRVIPQSERTKEDLMEEQPKKIAEASPTKKSKVDSSEESEECSKEKDEANLDAFHNIMDSTSVPHLPEIPQPLKCEQNFHSAKTIKFPDKQESSLENKLSASPTRKKQEKESLEETSPSITNKSKTWKKSDVSPVKEVIDVMPKKKHEMPLETEKTLVEKANEANITVESSETVGELSDLSKNENLSPSSVKTTSPVKEITTDTASKLINPKKRFVKSFEDSEQLNEQKKQEELQKQENLPSGVEVSKLKTRLMTKLSLSPEIKSPEKTSPKTPKYRKVKQLNIELSPEPIVTTAVIETDILSTSSRVDEDKSGAAESLETEIIESPKSKILRKTRKSELIEEPNKFHIEQQITSPTKSVEKEIRSDAFVTEQLVVQEETFKTAILSPKSQSSEDDTVTDKSDTEVNGTRRQRRKSASKEPVLSPKYSTRYPRKWRYRSDSGSLDDSNTTKSTEQNTPTESTDDSKSEKKTTKNYSKSPRRVSEINIEKDKNDEVSHNSKAQTKIETEMEVSNTYTTKRRKLRSSSLYSEEDQKNEPTKPSDTEQLNQVQKVHEPQDVILETKHVEKVGKRGRRRSSAKFVEDLNMSKTDVVAKDEYKSTETKSQPSVEINFEKTDSKVTGKEKLKDEITLNKFTLDTTDTIVDVGQKHNLKDSSFNKSVIEDEIMEVDANAKESTVINATGENTKNANDALTKIHNKVPPSTTTFSTTVDKQKIADNDKEQFSALSVLSTLATESELTNSFDTTDHTTEKTKQEGNLKVVTETDLADGQVEIANVPVAETVKSKPLTLSSFSVDFCDPNHTSSTETLPELKDKLGNKKADKNKELMEPKQSVQNTDAQDTVSHSKVEIKEQIIVTPQKTKVSTVKQSETDIKGKMRSLIVDKDNTVETEMAKVTHAKPEAASVPAEISGQTTSSKLLEILTDPKTKAPSSTTSLMKSTVVGHQMTKIHAPVTKEIIPSSKTLPKLETKNSKFVIKPMIPPNKPNVPSTSKQTKTTMVLAETIVKPVSESESVSVQKVTSKNSNDIEDIATFIIQRPVKKNDKDGQAENSTVMTTLQANRKPITSSKSRGKARILQQTIITPSGDVIQPPNIAQVQNDDNMFDINSMPIVLGDQILTPESIENMPVVLSDSTHLTPLPEKTVNILKKAPPQQMKLLNKSATPSPVLTQPTSLAKSITPTVMPKLNRNQKVYQASSSKLMKSSPAVITQAGKPGKFIIVPAGSTPTGSKYTVGKRPSVVKRSSPVVLPTTSVPKVQNIAAPSEPTGNKIMIVTNQQGQQSRVLLTPAQQKMLGYQTSSSSSSSSSSSKAKTAIKSNILQKTTPAKTILSPITGAAVAPKANIISQTVINSKGQIINTSGQNLITSDGQVLTPLTPQQIKGLKSDKGKKVPVQSRMVLQGGVSSLKAAPGPSKTIVIKNQQGQIVKKIQGTDEALLEQQVAEQVQAIKASTSFANMKAQVKSDIKPISKAAVKKSYAKKQPAIDTIAKVTNRTQILLNASVTNTMSKLPEPEGLPPLAPISPAKKVETVTSLPISNRIEEQLSTIQEEKKPDVQQRPLHQLVIQDGLGNQTVITEGQILAIPSETVDGQPHSYMLVTLDESGSLTPLNNEALLSLDPNLGLGGDLSNMVLQLDDGNVATADASKQSTADTAKMKTPEHELQQVATNTQPVVIPTPEEVQSEQTVLTAATNVPALVTSLEMPQERPVVEQIEQPVETIAAAVETTVPTTQVSDGVHQNLEAVHVTCSISNDPNQQLIITGDPISTQKFIESLTEGNADLANLLASAEGNILIQTDGQQILINTDSENQLLLPVGSENINVESTEGGGNPIFAPKPAKNQDILAAALADSDVTVFSQEQTSLPSHSKIAQSQLSPNSTLYPMNVGNILEPTLTINSPIMTPLEVPSSNNKKIPDEESDILTTEVPKNVDLPITITDPNISQTVAHQQAASLMSNELRSNLELPLTIPDTVPVTSCEMNSPSYVYSLPTLDEPDINQKAFSGSISMPLLTEEEPEPPENVEIPVSNAETIKEIPVEANVLSDTSHTDSVVTSSNDAPNIDLNARTSKSTSNIETVEECHKLTTTELSAESSFMGSVEDGLCTLGGEMCSSLSEPPPDMFDLSVMHSEFIKKRENLSDVKVTENTSKTEETATPESEELKAVDNLEPELNKTNDLKNESILTSESTEPVAVKDDNPISIQFTAANDVSPSNELDSATSKCEENTNTNLDEPTVDVNVQPQMDSEFPSDTFLAHETNNQRSPVDVDENSFEIPVQPQIVTNLSSEQLDTDNQKSDLQNNKRSFPEEDENTITDTKRSKFD